MPRSKAGSNRVWYTQDDGELVHVLRPVRDEKLVEAYEAGTPVSLLVSRFGIGHAAMLRILRARGAKIRPIGRPPGPPADTTPNARHQAIIDMYLDNKTLAEVGNHFRITRERVRQILVRWGVRERHHGVYGESRKEVREREAYIKLKAEAFQELRKWNREQVRADYDAGMTYKAMMHKYDKSLGFVQQQVKKTGGVKHRDRRDWRAEGRKALTKEQKQDLAWRYGIREKVGDIAKMYGVHPSYVAQVAFKLGYWRGGGPGVMEHFEKKLKEKK